MEHFFFAKCNYVINLGCEFLYCEVFILFFKYFLYVMFLISVIHSETDCIVLFVYFHFYKLAVL